MAYLVEIPVDGGGCLRVQVAADDLAGGLELAAVRPGQVAARASYSVEHALDQIKPAISSVIRKLHAMSPDEMSVEFGLGLSAEAGAIITKGRAEMHFMVSMSWKRSDTVIADEANEGYQATSGPASE